MRGVNPHSNGDALLDYKGDRRTTPMGALIDIKRLRNEVDLDGEQCELLDDLERHIIEKFRK